MARRAWRRVARRVLLDTVEDTTMKDLLFVGTTVAFFAVAWLYARSFERL
jgi:hypothetical protein